MTGLDFKIQEMAARIRELREITRFTPEEMAQKTDVSVAEYLDCERGVSDLNFAFIYRCALAFGVNVTDIIEGVSPTLKSYTVTRNGCGQKIEQAHGMTYFNLAPSFQNRIAEPLYVRSTYSAEAQTKDIELTTHAGQECDIVIEGHLQVQVGSHKEILGPGDSIYYDSGTPHGMIAVNGKDCLFYAIVLNPAGEPIPELMPNLPLAQKNIKSVDNEERIYQSFTEIEEDENGTPTKIEFKNTDTFNFAFDVIDAIADKKPEKLAMVHISKDKTERRFTFKDLKKTSAQCANYFRSIGIKKGDRVLLILRRHYQFWQAILGLHKMGAITILASNQMQAHDLQYRFDAAGISAILCTAEGDTAHQADLAAAECPQVKHKIIVGGTRDGWRDFDSEITAFSTHFYRTEILPAVTIIC